ncbi:MAG: MGMT family protein [Candidatus Saccharimonadales bacterium]
MDENLPTFRKEVIAIVKSIPKGRLMTYGQIAALAGSPRAARIVGGIAHYGDPDLPWQRVVNKKGYLAKGYPGGRRGHQLALEQEGILASDFKVPIEQLIWWPDN